ncbi:MAG: hypothetical protein AABX70_08240 [Nanoarchaeota archaeon]
MARVILTPELEQEIDKQFKEDSVNVFKLLLTLENNPKKGKALCHVGSIVLKELKYKSYRFYFITNGYKVKFLKPEQLKDLLIKFIRMSDKKTQSNVISEIKVMLRRLGNQGFEDHKTS